MCRIFVGDPKTVFRTSGKHIRTCVRARALIVAKPFVYKSCLHTRRLPHASEVFTNAESLRTRSPSQTREPRLHQESRHMRDPLKYECFVHARFLHVQTHFRTIAWFRNATKLCNKETVIFLSKQRVLTCRNRGC